MLCNVLSQLPPLCLGIFFALLDNLPYTILFLPADLESLIPAVASMVMNAVLVGQVVMASRSHFYYGLAACAVEGAPITAHLARQIRSSILAKLMLARSGADIDGSAAFVAASAEGISGPLPGGVARMVHSTVIVSFMLTSLAVATTLALLGRLRMGRLVNYLPKHVLMGTVGGVGVFLSFAGLGIAAGGVWQWDLKTIYALVQNAYAWEKVTAVLLIELSILVIAMKFPEAASSIVPGTLMLLVAGFYVALWCLGVSLETARRNGFVFDLDLPSGGAALLQTAGDVAVGSQSAISRFWSQVRGIALMPVASFGVWTHVDLRSIDVGTILSEFPTILAATFFIVLQPCVNIPALIHQDKSLPPGAADDELRTGAACNAIAAAAGAVPVYMTFSSSLFMRRCGFRYRATSFALAGSLFVIFASGPARLLNSLPRPAAGLFALHLGTTICREAFVDTAAGFDWVEYGTVFVIASLMQWDLVWGVASGLVLAVILFAARVARRRVVTLRSDELHVRHHRHVRSAAQMTAVDRLLREKVAVADIDAVDLFFANAQQLADELRGMLAAAAEPPQFLIINFARVSAVDCTAVGVVAAVVAACAETGVTVIFAAMKPNVMARCIRKTHFGRKGGGARTRDRVASTGTDWAIGDSAVGAPSAPSAAGASTFEPPLPGSTGDAAGAAAAAAAAGADRCASTYRALRDTLTAGAAYNAGDYGEMYTAEPQPPKRGDVSAQGRGFPVPPRTHRGIASAPLSPRGFPGEGRCTVRPHGTAMAPRPPFRPPSAPPALQPAPGLPAPATPLADSRDSGWERACSSAYYSSAYYGGASSRAAAPGDSYSASLTSPFLASPRAADNGAGGTAAADGSAAADQLRCVTVPELTPPGDLLLHPAKPLVRLFHTVDSAVEWCERHLRASAAAGAAGCPPGAPPRATEDLLDVNAYLMQLHACLQEESAAAAQRARASRFCFTSQLKETASEESSPRLRRNFTVKEREVLGREGRESPGTERSSPGRERRSRGGDSAESATTLARESGLPSGEAAPATFFTRLEFGSGCLVWRAGSPADGLLIVERGAFGVPDADFEKHIETITSEPRPTTRKNYHLSSYIESYRRARRSAKLTLAADEMDARAKVASHTGPFTEYFEAGQMVDGLSFLSQSSRAWSLVAVTPAAAYCLTTDQLRSLQARDPGWALVLFRSALREANLLLRSAGGMHHSRPLPAHVVVGGGAAAAYARPGDAADAVHAAVDGGEIGHTAAPPALSAAGGPTLSALDADSKLGAAGI